MPEAATKRYALAVPELKQSLLAVVVRTLSFSIFPYHGTLVGLYNYMPSDR